MEIHITTDFLKKNNLTISEYLHLKVLFEHNSFQSLTGIVEPIDFSDLQQRGFIKILNNEIVLRQKGVELFDIKDDLFLSFLNRFPIKTPSGRYLSPLGSYTIKSKNVEKKWNKLFGKNKFKQQRAIDVLEAELEWRKQTNQLEYMQNIETWLNQGNYENYAYLLEEKKEDYKDFM